jgi:hypothetical protein
MVSSVAMSVVAVGGAVALERELGYKVSRHGISKPEPLGFPPTPPAGDGGYSFTRAQPSSTDPVTYSPCEAIHFVVDDELAPADARGLVHAAVTEISAHTGLVFVFDGITDEQPTRRLEPRDEGPALISWSSPEAVPGLAGDVAGLGGSTSRLQGTSGRERYVSGQVVLDAPQFEEILHRPGGRRIARAIILHELGHLVGLGHVEDPTQLMSEHNEGVLEFADGDRRGLALLGSGDCGP